MTKDNAAQYVPIIQGWANGKTIQLRHGSFWGDINSGETLNFMFPPDDYRIKPEPSLRPWLASEVPVGKTLKAGEGLFYLILAATNSGVRIADVSGFHDYPYGHLLLAYYSWSSDGLNWQKCGIMEDKP